jgi:hypothetical protein
MTSGTSVRSRQTVRIGLVVLACTQAVIGVWALLTPRGFYDGFPAAGHAWVALLPPYNEHLVRDVGGLSLAMTVLLGAAAIHLERRLVRVAVLAFGVYTVPHALFHGLHLEGFSVLDAVAQMIGFAVQLGIVLGVLILIHRQEPT